MAPSLTRSVFGIWDLSYEDAYRGVVAWHEAALS